MSINPIKLNYGKFAEIKAVPEQLGFDKSQAPQAAKGSSFGELLSKSLHEVDGLQKQANSSIENLMLGKPGVTTHDTMIALEKADTAFQLMNNIRSRIIRAYEEILRTQV